MNWFGRIFMGLLGLAMVAVLLVALGVYILYATLRWLFTGRKPQVVLVWQQFGQMRRRAGARWGQGDSAGPSSDRVDDVVDVEVREVRDNTISIGHRPKR